MKIFLSAVLLAFAVSATAADKPAMPSQPELVVTTLDGQPWQLADHRGKWVVVNFWATWCTPCIAEMPEIDGFDQAHDQVSVIGLAWQDAKPAKIQAFLQQHPVAYPVAIANPFDPPADFAAPLGLPTTYVIDPEGRVSQKFVGPVTAVDLAKAVGVPTPES